MNAANFAAFASFAFLPALCLRMEDVVVVRAFGSAAGLWWLAFLPSAGVAPEPEGTPEPLDEPAEGSAESVQSAASWHRPSGEATANSSSGAAAGDARGSLPAARRVCVQCRRMLRALVRASAKARSARQARRRATAACRVSPGTP